MSDRYLLDSHARVWWADLPGRLPSGLRDRLVAADSVTVSDVSLWELPIKCGTGKLRLVPDVGTWFDQMAGSHRWRRLRVDDRHVALVEHLSHHHHDPFDRRLVAQATHERLTLVSRDPWFAEYDIEAVWA